MAKKISRKKLLKEPDEFITFTSKTIQWCRRYPKQLTYGIGGVVAVIVVLVAVKTINAHRATAANALLGQGISQLQAADNPNEPSVQDVDTTFDELIADFDGQPAGRLGRIVYAHAQLTQGLPDKAIGLYQNALKDFKQDPILATPIQNGLASAYEEKQMTAEAIIHFETIAKGNNKMLKDRALFHLGRLYRIANETEKSRKAYEQLITEFPESIYTPIAKEMMG